MADNVTLNEGSGGTSLAVASLSFSGDTAGVQLVGCGILSGSEGSWTHSQMVGGAGAVAAGVQRVTLASDDPAVVDLAALEVLSTAANVDLAAIEVLQTSIDGKITACNTGAVVISSGTVTTVSTVTNLAQLGGVAIAMNEGILGPGVQRVSLATDDDAVSHLSAISKAVEIMDDWDEGDRAKANPIVGQAGVAAGDGVVGVTVPRVTLANNDTLTAAANALLTTIDSDTNDIKTAVEIIDNPVQVFGTDTYTEATDSAMMAGAVRNDDLATLADTDNEIAPLQVNSEGALYTTDVAAETKRASGVAAGGTPGTDDIVAAVASRKLRVLALALFATSATANNVFLDNADNDLLFNTANPLALALDADGDNVAGFVLPFNAGGWFETDTVNEAITLNSSAAQDVAWTITYIEVL